MENTLMQNPEFRWNWGAANGNDVERLRQVRAANEVRLQQLQARLSELRATTQLTGADELDLELAANRARAYDLTNAEGALTRLDNRREARQRDDRERQRAAMNKQLADDLKLAEYQKQYQQAVTDLNNTADKPGRARQQATVDYLAKQIEAMGGSVPKSGYDGPDKSEVYEMYYKMTTNTPNGRKFNDGVTGEMRDKIVRAMFDIGEYEKAAALQATRTPKEIEQAKQEEAAKKRKIKTSVARVNKELERAQEVYKTDTKAGIDIRNAAMDIADSLTRNYGEYVKLQDGRLQYTAKD